MLRTLDTVVSHVALVGLPGLLAWTSPRGVSVSAVVTSFLTIAKPRTVLTTTAQLHAALVPALVQHHGNRKVPPNQTPGSYQPWSQSKPEWGPLRRGVRQPGR